jgi:hypothetical protein
MVVVYAARGPLAGRRVEIADEEEAAATAKDGWALRLKPGTVLFTEPDAPHDPCWKIPGLEVPAQHGKAVEAEPPKAGAAKAAPKK